MIIIIIIIITRMIIAIISGGRTVASSKVEARAFKARASGTGAAACLDLETP